jgi:DNA/RNA non-specific endonuclease
MSERFTMSSNSHESAHGNLSAIFEITASSTSWLNGLWAAPRDWIPKFPLPGTNCWSELISCSPSSSIGWRAAPPRRTPPKTAPRLRGRTPRRPRERAGGLRVRAPDQSGRAARREGGGGEGAGDAGALSRDTNCSEGDGTRTLPPADRSGLALQRRGGEGTGHASGRGGPGRQPVAAGQRPGRTAGAVGGSGAWPGRCGQRPSRWAAVRPPLRRDRDEVPGDGPAAFRRRRGAFQWRPAGRRGIRRGRARPAPRWSGIQAPQAVRASHGVFRDRRGNYCTDYRPERRQLFVEATSVPKCPSSNDHVSCPSKWVNRVPWYNKSIEVSKGGVALVVEDSARTDLYEPGWWTKFKAAPPYNMDIWEQGHVIASRLGGRRDNCNFTAQYRHVNQRIFKRCEARIAEAVKPGCGCIRVTVTVTYMRAHPVVPSKFRIVAEGIRGNKYKLDVTFNNDPNEPIPPKCIKAKQP